MTYHGVFAPNSAHRSQVTPARRGKGSTPNAPGTGSTPAERHAAMTWAQRLKRVFNIDIETCRQCGGAFYSHLNRPKRATELGELQA